MFSLLPAFKHGWQSAKNFFWTFLPVTLVFSGLDYIASEILEGAGFENVVDYATLTASLSFDLLWKMAVIGLVTVIANFFAVTLSVAVLRGESPAKLLKARLDRFLPFILLMILKSLLISLGLMLFVVPGIVVMFALYFVEYLYIDRPGKLTDCIRQSWDMTRGLRLGIFFFEFDVFLITYLVSFPQVLWPDTPVTYAILVLTNTILLPVVWNAAAHIFDSIDRLAANRPDSV